MSVYFQDNSNQWNLRPTQDPIGLTQESTEIYRTSEKQTEVEKNETEIDQTISYAKYTLLNVDQKAENCLVNFVQEHGNDVFPHWLGKVIDRILCEDKDYISIQNARIANSKAKTEIFEIHTENVVAFAVDRVIRNRLDLLTKIEFRSICRQFEIPEDELAILKRGEKVMIEKQDADKFNAYFQKRALKKGELSTEVFDLERIFQLALNEPVHDENSIKLTEMILIKMETSHRRGLSGLSRKIRRKLREMIGYNFRHINERSKSITIRNAVLINKISEKKIFDFSVNSIITFPIFPEQLAILEKLTNQHQITKEIFAKIYRLCHGQRKISLKTANEINAYFGRQVFDIQSMLSRAVQEAEDDVSLKFSPSTSSTSKKRSSSDISSPEDHSYTNNLQNGELGIEGTLNLIQALPATNQPNLNKLGDEGRLKAGGYPTSSKTNSSDCFYIELNAKKPRVAAFDEHFVKEVHSPINIDWQISLSGDLSSQVEIESEDSPPFIEMFVPPNDFTVQLEFDPPPLCGGWTVFSISSAVHSSDVVALPQDLSGQVEYGPKEEWETWLQF